MAASVLSMRPAYCPPAPISTSGGRNASASTSNRLRIDDLAFARRVISALDTLTSGAALSLSASSGSVSGTSLLSKGDIALLSGLDLGFSGLVRSEGNVQARAGTGIQYGGMEANGNIALSSLAGVISLDRRTAAAAIFDPAEEHRSFCKPSRSRRNGYALPRRRYHQPRQ